MWRRQHDSEQPVLEVKDVARVTHMEALRALHVQWLDFADDAGFAIIMQRGLEIAAELRALTWIADTARTTGSMSTASQHLLSELHASGAGPRSGLQAVITVQPRHLLAHLSNQWWHREISSGVYTIESVATLDEAIQLAELIRDQGLV